MHPCINVLSLWAVMEITCVECEYTHQWRHIDNVVQGWKVSTEVSGISPVDSFFWFYQTSLVLLSKSSCKDFTEGGIVRSIWLKSRRDIAFGHVFSKKNLPGKNEHRGNIFPIGTQKNFGYV